jgi:hypothetical protein
MGLLLCSVSLSSGWMDGWEADEGIVFTAMYAYGVLLTITASDDSCLVAGILRLDWTRK